MWRADGSEEMAPGVREDQLDLSHTHSPSRNVCTRPRIMASQPVCVCVCVCVLALVDKEQNVVEMTLITEPLIASMLTDRWLQIWGKMVANEHFFASVRVKMCTMTIIIISLHLQSLKCPLFCHLSQDFCTQIRICFSTKTPLMIIKFLLQRRKGTWNRVLSSLHSRNYKHGEKWHPRCDDLHTTDNDYFKCSATHPRESVYTKTTTKFCPQIPLLTVNVLPIVPEASAQQLADQITAVLLHKVASLCFRLV